MTIKAHPPLQVFGYLTSCDFAAKNLTPVGLQTILLGTPSKPYSQCIDPAGNVAGFVPIRALSATEFVASPLPIVPQIGSPFLCAFVADPARPNEMEVMYWHDTAERAAHSYPAMRSNYMKYPVAGFRVANFLLAVAPAYEKSAGQKILHPESFPLELEMIATDDEHHYRRSEIVIQFARAAGIDLKPRREGQYHEMPR